MLPAAKRCTSAFKQISKPPDLTTKTTCIVRPYTVNVSCVDPSTSPMISSGALVSSVLARQRCSHVNFTLPPMFSRGYQSLVRPKDSSVTYTIRDEPRRVLKPSEVLYNIRVGDGVVPPVSLFNGTQPEKIRVYLSVYSLDEDQEIKEIAISSYSRNILDPYRAQGPGGARSFPDTILNYSFTSSDRDSLMCCLSLEHEDGIHLGRCYLSLEKPNSVGTEPAVRLPVINETDTIVGTMHCSVIEVEGLDTPFSTSPPPPLFSSPHTPLEIGHRGCGVTHTDRQLFDSLPCLPENTIGSLMMAYQHGADMVETDVAVTQDQKAVVHHDLEIQVDDVTAVPISHVTSNILEKLPRPNLEITETEAREQLLSDRADNMDLIKEVDQFPTLVEILHKLPSKLGIMLEIKSNIPEVGIDAVPYHSDKNTYVDTILTDLFENCGSRKIILCSFCPTTCVMLRNKQDRWPVVLIVQGSTDTYVDYTDTRLQDLQLSANFAISENLHGLSIFSGLLLEEAESKVAELQKLGLSTFVWGYHASDAKFRQKMRDCNVHGVIYDKIYEEKLEKRKVDEVL